jgi:hypothetical protein
LVCTSAQKEHDDKNGGDGGNYLGETETAKAIPNRVGMSVQAVFVHRAVPPTFTVQRNNRACGEKDHGRSRMRQSGRREEYINHVVLHRRIEDLLRALRL